MGILTRAFLAVAPRRAIRAAFTRHYVRRDWDDPESVSGRGSSIQRTEAIRSALPALFRELNVRSVLDAGCGDFNWFGSLTLDLDSYVGVEVVGDLTRINNERYESATRRFVSLDIAHDPLPRADLILCRDVLVHLKNRHIIAALRNFRRSHATYLLATTFTGDHRNEDVPLGGWRPLNLERPPFNLGVPLRVISEAASVEDASYRDKSLGLWRL